MGEPGDRLIYSATYAKGLAKAMSVDEWPDNVSVKQVADLYHAGYRAGAESKQAEIERLREAQALVDEQANVEGLWCEAETIMEAVLQKALRELHEKIEGVTAEDSARQALAQSPEPSSEGDDD